MNNPPSLRRAFDPAFLDASGAALQQLLDDVPEVMTAVLASSDGFELASRSRDGAPASRLSALASSLLALGHAALRELRFAGGGTVLIENEAGKIYVAEAAARPHPTVLCVVAGHEVMSGKLLWAARRCLGALTAT